MVAWYYRRWGHLKSGRGNGLGRPSGPPGKGGRGPGRGRGRPGRGGGGGGAGSSLIFEDTFTEASNKSLALHTPDTGTGWLVYGSQGNNTLQVDSIANRCWVHTVLTPNFGWGEIQDSINNDQRVEGDLFNNDSFNGILARFTHRAVAGEDWDGYCLFHNAGTLYLYRHGTGGFTLLDSVALTFSAGETLRLDCVGSDIKGYVNDTLRVSATDSTFPSGGAGVRAIEGSDAFLDNFKVYNL